MGEVEAILDVVEEHFGRIPAGMAVSADAGNFSETNVMLFEDALLKPYIATGRLKNGEVPPTIRGRPPKDLTPKEDMTRKLSTKRGQTIYSKRKSTVEPVFGQINQARGLRQFLFRGKQMCLLSGRFGASPITSSSSTGMEALSDPREGAFVALPMMTAGADAP